MSSARSRSGGTRIGNTLSRKKQVRAEPPLADRFLQVPVGGRHHASVRPQRLAAAHALELALLEHAQEGDLDRRRQLAHLVEEDRAAGRQLEAALAPLQGAGEGSPLVAEQLRGDEPLRERGAVDLDQRALGSRRTPCGSRARSSSLPVPVSPVISTVESVAATRATRSSTSRSPAEAPMIPPAAAVAAISSAGRGSRPRAGDRSFWISSKASAFATAVVTGRATSSRTCTSSGRERRSRHAREHQRADELVAHGQRQHHRALGTRVA